MILMLKAVFTPPHRLVAYLISYYQIQLNAQHLSSEQPKNKKYCRMVAIETVCPNQGSTSCTAIHFPYAATCKLALGAHPVPCLSESHRG